MPHGVLQALQAAAGIADRQSAAKLQLQAQVHYRLSQYGTAIQLYEQLAASHKVSWGHGLQADSAGRL